jgi:protein-disulfide isomerase
MIQRKTQTLCGLALMAFFAATASLGQEASSQDIEELKKEIQALKAGQRAIQIQLQQISNLLKKAKPRPTPFKEVTLDVGNRPFKGNESAGLTLIEFSDYQ